MKKSFILCSSIFVCIINSLLIADTPLHDAVREGKRDRIATLLNKGAAINSTDATSRQTPLYVAVREGKGSYEIIVYLLLSHGADPNIFIAGFPLAPYVLMAAVTKRNQKVITWLLNYGAHINKVAPLTGQTALHLAAELGYYDIVKLLLDTGADISITDRRGKAPIDLARDKGYHHIVALLQAHAPKQIHRFTITY